MTQNQKMRDFVKSLENNQFSKEQEAMLLVGKADTLQAGSNGECEYCVNLIVLRIVLKKKKDSLVFLIRGIGRRLEYSGILRNPVALL